MNARPAGKDKDSPSSSEEKSGDNANDTKTRRGSADRNNAGKGDLKFATDDEKTTLKMSAEA